jgi:hypothetical protein
LEHVCQHFLQTVKAGGFPNTGKKAFDYAEGWGEAEPWMNSKSFLDI